MSETIEFQLNGKQINATESGDRLLLWYLRTDHQFTGTKYGCGEGHCGACTVLLNGQTARSCTLRVRDVARMTVLTIEGLGPNGQLHPMQQAFIDHDAFQCGYCTSGMILEAIALIEKNPNPSRADIQKGLQGHLCRCGAYQRIIEAVQAAARVMQHV
jgi:nicotinate dehydrogenase subunit A